MNIRRVVTGHDDEGHAVVRIDEICGNVISRRRRHQSCLIWSTGSFPADNSDDVDGGAREIGTTQPDRTLFRIVEYGPGVAPRNHRTESIDYAVVLSGEVDVQLVGTAVHLRAGDVLAHRGTIHTWGNRRTQACVLPLLVVAGAP